MRYRSIVYAATALVAVAAAPAPAAVVVFQGDGVLTGSGNPFTVTFAWETSIRPQLGQVPSPAPGGTEPGPVYAVNPLRGPLTVTGNFGTLVYDNPSFNTRFESDRTRYFVEFSTVSPLFPGPYRIASVQLSTAPVADPYATDLPSNLNGATGFFNLLDPSTGTTLVGGPVTIVSSTPAVPEPATWLAMVIGFTALGWTIRRTSATARLSAIA